MVLRVIVHDGEVFRVMDFGGKTMCVPGDGCWGRFDRREADAGWHILRMGGVGECFMQRVLRDIADCGRAFRVLDVAF
jgi:hypothetical protein